MEHSPINLPTHFDSRQNARATARRKAFLEGQLACHFKAFLGGDDDDGVSLASRAVDHESTFWVGVAYALEALAIVQTHPNEPAIAELTALVAKTKSLLREYARQTA